VLPVTEIVVPHQASAELDDVHDVESDDAGLAGDRG
jgi:hypothetical protein